MEAEGHRGLIYYKTFDSREQNEYVMRISKTGMIGRWTHVFTLLLCFDSFIRGHGKTSAELSDSSRLSSSRSTKL